jgi:hypothetical protein
MSSSTPKQPPRDTTTTSTNHDSLVLDVLFGKTKKSKGGSHKAATKRDGILTIIPPPSCMVSLVDVTEAEEAAGEETSTSRPSTVVYRGAQKEIAKRCCSDGIQVDDMLVVGQYEVEILAIRGNSQSKKDKFNKQQQHPKNGFSKPMIISRLGRQPLSLLSSKHPTQLQQRPAQQLQSLARKPLYPIANRLLAGVIRSSDPIRSKAPQGEILSTRVAPSKQMLPTKTGKESGDESCDSDDSSSSACHDGDVDGENARTTLQQHPVVPGSQLLKRPFVSPATTASSSTFDSSTRRQRLIQGFQTTGTGRRPVESISSTTRTTLLTTCAVVSSSTTTTTIRKNVSATATLDIPHSVRSVLKPHQEEGLDFLWKCLTGAGTARPRDHKDKTCPTLRGAILADEMGLGKTLMTIAVICGLYRQKRDTVRLYSSWVVAPGRPDTHGPACAHNSTSYACVVCCLLFVVCC